MGTITGKKIGPGLWDQRKCQWCAERAELIGD